jgi:hypothetical protein
MRTLTRFTAPIAAAALIAAAFVGVAPAAPAHARVPLTIPSCASMLPARTFTVLPGLAVARPFTPAASAPLYGATNPSLQSAIRANPNRTCSWSAGLADKSFTISEVDVDPGDVAALRAWYSARGYTPRFYGGNAAFYSLPVNGKPTWIEVHILDPEGAWITVTDRFFSSGGAISQDAYNQLAMINPWLI